MTGTGMVGRLAGVLAALGLATLALAAASASCGRQVPPAGTPKVVVTVPPLAGLVERLAPGRVGVTTLIKSSQSEHGAEFTPADVAALRSADVVVYIGLGLEPRVEQYLAAHPDPKRRVVCFADAVGLKPRAGHEAEAHAKGAHAEGTHDEDHDEHDHGPLDPHLWLDPDLVLRLVPVLADALGSATGADLSERRDALEAEIRALDAECKAKLAPLAGKTIVTHHAAWGRFAEHFGLRVAAVIRPIEASEPTNTDLQAAIDAVRAEGAGGVFVEPQFNADAARKVARLAGVKLGLLDPLGDGDWFKLMRSNVDSLVKTLGP